MPTPSGLTVSAPRTTWSLIPSFGYGVVGADPKTSGAFVSFSQKSSSGCVSVRAGRCLEHVSGQRVVGDARSIEPWRRDGRARSQNRHPMTTCCETTASATRRASPLGAVVLDLDPHHDLVRRRLRVGHFHRPVPVAVEHTRVEQLELGIAPAHDRGGQAARRGRPPAGSGSASGEARGSAVPRGTTSTP